MSARTQTLHRVKTEYTDGARRLAANAVRGLQTSSVTPNQLTALGFALNLVAAVLIWRHDFFVAGAVFLIGSLIDILDGALARSTGRATQIGALIDSTTDRLSEGFVLGAIGIVFMQQGRTWALVATFAALTCSFLISYTRARAESLGLDGKAGLMGRAERVVLLGVTLLASPWGALPYGVALLALLAAVTVVQRVDSVRRQLARDAAGLD